MDIFSSSLPERDATGQTKMPAAQSPWQLPAFGTLGPDSDVEVSALSPVEHGDGDTRPPERKLRNLHWVALLAGALCALLVSAVRNLPAREGTNPSAAGRQRSSQFSISTSGLLEAQKPQKKAELLLARAVSRNDEAVAQIQAQADSWRGHIKWTSQLSDLTTVALNSNDYDLRASAIEVQLAAYGLAKQEFTVDRLIRQANTSEHATRIWALWSLGLLGNRGIETFRVLDELTSQTKVSAEHSDPDTRRWAVEGLAMVGTNSTIVPVLLAMHDDPSPLVRERAACSLAESGMLSHEARLMAVPQLIHYSDDPTLDAQTHAWAFQALNDITGQALPHDSAAWRNWYQQSGGTPQ